VFVENNYPEKGRLYSLYIALKDLPSSDFAIIHNVDNPFVDNEVIHSLCKERRLNGTTIPTYNQKAGHPIIIDKTVMNEIVENYEKYETLKEVINQFDKKYVEVKSPNILTNINTPQDYNKVINEFV
jgi:molybdenum cofactor cytidylyltransferase